MVHLSYILEEIRAEGHECYGCKRDLHEDNCYNLIRVRQEDNMHEFMSFHPTPFYICEKCSEKVKPIIETANIKGGGGID